MLRRLNAGIMSIALTLVMTGPAGATGEATIARAESVLSEIMQIPAQRIPSDLLASAHGVAIIPSVIKIGFIGGVRRGHGVILVRDREGDWSLPEFVTLTGGSIGWQAGAQSTDVILVFRTARSVENIRRGRFTIGADAAAAAGPVGRNMAAATDLQLRAEILSYSRSRGLFAGISLDGSMLEVDHRATRDFYGDPNAQPPRQVSPAAVRLMEAVAAASRTAPRPGPAPNPGAAPAVPQAPDANQLRQDLAQAARVMNGILTSDWQSFLALPPTVFGTAEHPPIKALEAARTNFERVVSDPTFAALRSRPEFQTTFDILREYIQALQAQSPTLILPPPPPPK